MLDTGIDAAHPAPTGVSLLQEDCSGSGSGDRQGHGTHCAGTVVGRDVDGTRIGVATGADPELLLAELGELPGARVTRLLRCAPARPGLQPRAGWYDDLV